MASHGSTDSSARRTLGEWEKAPIEAWEEQRKKPWQVYVDAELGFRNHWYPAFYSGELDEADVSTAKGEPVSNFKVLTMLGERIFFRRIDGEVRAVQDWCLHRGVPFSTRPECYTKDSLTCWYHGFTYDLDDGRLSAVITDPQSPLRGKLALRTYPVVEAKSIVWVFVGDVEPVPPLAADVPPGLLAEPHYVYPDGWSKVVQCNWRPSAENGFDPAHAYIHRNSKIVEDYKVAVPFSVNEISRSRDMEIFDQGEGPYGVNLLRGTAPSVWEADVHGVKVTSQFKPGEEGVFNGEIPEVSVWMPGSVKVDPFPAPGVIHYEFYVPIDADSHRYMITWGKDVASAAERDEFVALMRDEWVDRVLGQFSIDDVFAREQMAEFYRGDEGWFRERLFGPDVAITTWRKLASRTNRGVQRPGRQ